MRAGTTGDLTNPFGPLITGAANWRGPEFDFFQVPDSPHHVRGISGAPSVTG